MNPVIPGSLQTAWDDLCDRTGAPPWTRPGWAEAWFRAFGSGRPDIATITDAGELAALMALERERGELRTAASAETPGCALLAVNDDAAKALAADLYDRGARVVTLWPMPDADAAVLRNASTDAGYRMVERIVGRTPFISTELGWETYNLSLNRKLRSEIRRRRRRLEESGEVTVDVHDGRTDLDSLLDAAFGLEAAGWKGRRGTAIALHPNTLRFYREMSAWAADRGWLRLAFLRLDDRPIAFDFSFEDDKCHYLMKTSFDPDAHALAPGVLLRHEMVRRSFDLGHSTYEFLGHDEAWKLYWTKERHDYALLKSFAPTLAGTTHRNLYRSGRRLKLAMARRKK